MSVGNSSPPAQVAATLDRRLDPTSTAPLGLALSGGGDSVALLSLVAPWAQAHGRRMVAFTVDHGLNRDSQNWTAFAADLARRFGAEPLSLTWTGPKPTIGLPAAARAARHALIAAAARARGVKVVLFAHTADDMAEGEWMRSQGASLGIPRDWAPSPAWPEGRGVFLLRPLLDVGRAALRSHLAAQDLPWLEDPANADPRFLRSRARAELSSSASATPDDRTHRTLRSHLFHGPESDHLILPRATIDRPSLSAALLCASGGQTPPRGVRLAALLDRVTTGQNFAATLSDARIKADGDRLLLAREPGRAGLSSLGLEPGLEAVWDSRWLVATPHAGITVRALAGLTSRLSSQERRALAALPAAVRPTLPAFVQPDAPVTCPPLEPTTHAARALVAERFAAAIGLIHREAEIISHPPLLAR